MSRHKIQLRLHLDDCIYVIEAPLGIQIIQGKTIDEPDFLVTTDGSCVAERVVLLAARCGHHGLKLCSTEKHHIPL